MENNKFKKEERLCNKRLINVLYESGSSFILYPYKVVFHPANELAFPVQVLISVPKRRFKRAVDRNLLKRRIREAYRLQKNNLLYSSLGDNQILLSIQYIGNKIEPYDYIFNKMSALMLKLHDEYAKVHMG
jgi:ribonuclease P protein component